MGSVVVLPGICGLSICFLAALLNASNCLIIGAKDTSFLDVSYVNIHKRE